MKIPIQNSDTFSIPSPEEVPVELRLKENKVSEYFDSDLHDENSVMLAEIYGGDFQKVWRKTHKKWWA